MAMADSRSWVLFSKSFFVLFVLGLVLVPKILVVADDVDEAYGGGGGGGGGMELCNGEVMSFLPLPYSNMSNVICRPVWNTYALRYSQSDDHVVTVVLSAIYTTGWVGMGFSKYGMMAGSSAMVGWISRQGHARIKQYYLRGTKSSEVIPEKGELPLTNIPPAVVLHGATIYLAFQMKFTTHRARQPILLAFSSSYPVHSHLRIHDDKTTMVFDFSAGSVSSIPKNIGQMKANHGILGIVGWGLVLPVGAIIARYFRHKDPLWYYLHTVIQFVGFIIILANLVIGQSLYDKIHADQPAHRGIGIFAFVLGILQILAFFLRPNKDAKIRKFWNWYHHWFGRLALFFGSLNIVLGIQIGHPGDDWKIGYGFLLGAILLSVIILEALAFIRRSQKPAPTPAFQMNPIQ